MVARGFWEVSRMLLTHSGRLLGWFLRCCEDISDLYRFILAFIAVCL